MRTRRIRIDASLDDTHATLYNVRGEIIARVLREDLAATVRMPAEIARLDPNDPWTAAINRMAKSHAAKPSKGYGNADDPWGRRIASMVICANTRKKSQVSALTGKPAESPTGKRGNRSGWDWERSIKAMVYDLANKDRRARESTWERWAETVSRNHNQREAVRQHVKHHA